MFYPLSKTVHHSYSIQFKGGCVKDTESNAEQKMTETAAKEIEQCM